MRSLGGVLACSKCSNVTLDKKRVSSINLFWGTLISQAMEAADGPWSSVTLASLQRQPLYPNTHQLGATARCQANEWTGPSQQPGRQHQPFT